MAISLTIPGWRLRSKMLLTVLGPEPISTHTLVCMQMSYERYKTIAPYDVLKLHTCKLDKLQILIFL